MKFTIKILIAFVASVFILFPMHQNAKAASINTKNSRVTYQLKDTNGKKYTVYLIGDHEQKSKASFEGPKGWDFTWARMDEDDLLYHGNYKLYTKAKTVLYSGYEIKDYTLNKTKKMVYLIPSKYKGQPDLMAISEMQSSNFDSAHFYYMKNGK